MENLRRELERFVTPGLARYALTEAEHIDALLGELRSLERQYHTLTRAWPLLGVLLEDEETSAGRYGGTILAIQLESTSYEAHATLAEGLLSSLEDYNGRLWLWGGGRVMAFFPGYTRTGASTDADLFRACLTAAGLLDSNDRGFRAALATGDARLTTLEATGRKAVLPTGRAVEESLLLLEQAPPGTILLTPEVAEEVNQRFEIIEDTGRFSLGKRIEGSRINRVVVNDPVPEPPVALLERLSVAVEGMERVRPWFTPEQLSPLGNRQSGINQLASEGLLAVSWPAPTELARSNPEALEKRLRLEIELCATWEGTLWGIIPGEAGLVSIYSFSESLAAASAGYALLNEGVDCSCSFARGNQLDHLLRGGKSTVAVPDGAALRRAVTALSHAPTGQLVCHPGDVTSVEAEFEEERKVETGEVSISLLAPTQLREEAGLPLLGMNAVIEAANGWLEELKAGRSVIGAISGGAGSGKSRTAEELIDLFAEQGEAYLFRCQSWWRHDPYSLWRRVLLALWGAPASSTAEESQKRALGDAASGLKLFVSRFVSGELHEPLWGLSPTEKQGMAQELLLAALKERGGRPLTLIVDDADQLDSGSIHLCQSLASLGLPLGIILVGGAKPTGVDASVIPLEPLDEEEAVQLFSSLTETAELPFRRLPKRNLTPGRITDLAQLAKSGTLAESYTRLSPEQLARELFKSSADADLLKVVSILGQRFDTGDLAALTTEVGKLRQRLEDEPLLRRKAGRYSFHSAALWSFSYSQLNSPERRELHLNAARFYQRRHSGISAQAVNHFMYCGDPRERITALELAGNRAAAVGSFVAAQGYLRKAIETEPDRRDFRHLSTLLADSLGEEVATFTDGIDILKPLYENREEGEEQQCAEIALKIAGIMCRYRQKSEDIEKWLEKSAQLDSENKLLHRRMLVRGESSLIERRYDDALVPLKKAAQAQDVGGALARFHLGEALLALKRPADALVQFKKAWDWAQESSRVPLLIDAGRGMARVHSELGEPEQAKDILEAALQRERALFQTESIAETLTDLADHYIEVGESSRALAYLAEAEKNWERLDKLTERIAIQQKRALLLAETGQLSEAIGLLTPTIEWRRKHRDRYGLATLSFELARLESIRGNHRAAEKLFSDAIVTARAIGNDQLIDECRVEYARSFFLAGKLTEGYEQLSQVEKSAATLSLEGELLRELYLFDAATEKHREALRLSDNANPWLRLMLATDQLEVGKLASGQKVLAEFTGPLRANLMLDLAMLRAKAILAVGGRYPRASEACASYQLLADDSGAVWHRALAQKLLATQRAMDGKGEEAVEGLTEFLAENDPPDIVAWQLWFLRGVLSKETEQRQKAKSILDRLAATMPDAKLKQQLFNSAIYRSLKG